MLVKNRDMERTSKVVITFGIIGALGPISLLVRTSTG
jgi:hypothetical protein